MAYDIESSLRCSHCLCVPSFVVCKPAPRVCVYMRLYGGDSCVVFHPLRCSTLRRGAFTPLGVGSGVQLDAK